MIYNPVFSVIIPHRDSAITIPRLMESIPESPDIEIIIVDNSNIKVNKEAFNVRREFCLYYSDPRLGAGGARNMGIEKAHGTWLLFADADDYYAKGAFDLYRKYQDASVDIVYTGMGGVYENNGLPAPRGDRYCKLIKDYLNGTITEDILRTQFHSPCCKMVRRSLVNDHSLRYSEVIAGNDAFFSMASGFYANKIIAIDQITYVATVSNGSLTQRKDKEAFLSRYTEDLKINSFLKTHGKPNLQYKVLGTIWQSRKYGIKVMYNCLKLASKYKQNIFVGLK